jgi:intracellular sulfur oxidation DsrE/DsrF family protein
MAENKRVVKLLKEMEEHLKRIEDIRKELLLYSSGLDVFKKADNKKQSFFGEAEQDDHFFGGKGSTF